MSPGLRSPVTLRGSCKGFRDFALGCDFCVRVADEVLDAARPEIAARPAPHGDGALRRLTIPDDQHVRDLLELRFANLEVYLFLPRVELDPQSGRRQAVA